MSHPTENELARARRDKKRAVIYARVSSPQFNRQHPENQIEPLEQWCKEHGYLLVHSYIDRDSGAKSERQHFVQMMEAARRREFDLVVCWSLDRFTREGAPKTFRYIQQLNDNDVSFYSYTEPEARSNNEGPMRDALIFFASWVAQWERRRRQERVQAGMDRARAAGRKMGRKPKEFSEKQLARMKALHAANHSLRAIARKLKTTKATVQRRLQA